MEYFIAIDSGGTKTDTVLFDETGHIIHRDLSKGCNAMDIGTEEAKRRMWDIIQRVEAIAPKPVKAIFGGIAGTDYFGDFLAEYIRPMMKAERMHIEDDGGNMISGAVGRVDACSMVCGTGSSLFVRKDGKLVKHVGGRGYLIDTGGSGFDLGQAAIRHALRAIDGRGESTVLVELVEKQMGTDLHHGMCEVYTKGRAYVASFARCVFAGRDMGDLLCHRIIDEQATKMAELTWAAEKCFEGEFTVAMGGGIFAAYPDYVELVKAKSSRRANMICANVPPVFGAAVEALADGGFECTEEIKARFLEEYAAL